MSTTRAVMLAEVRTYLSAEDEKPVIPEITDGKATGLRLALDIIEAQFTFDESGMPQVIACKVRGFPLGELGGETVYASTEPKWAVLDIGIIPRTLDDQIGQLRVAARRAWREIKGAK